MANPSGVPQGGSHDTPSSDLEFLPRSKGGCPSADAVANPPKESLGDLGTGEFGRFALPKGVQSIGPS